MMMDEGFTGTGAMLAPGEMEPAGEATGPGDQPLRQDVRMLGFELGQVLKRHGSMQLFQLVEEMRRLSKRRRAGDAQADEKLRATIAGLDAEPLRDVIRALSCFFDLANLAEDRHRIRVLRERERALGGAPQPESIAAAVAALRERGFDADEVQALIDKLDIELVLTAHPTEAKRLTVRNTLNRLRQDLIELERADLLPRERDRLAMRMQADLACLWETEPLHPRRPTVLEEVRRSLFAVDSLWQITPQLYRTMRSGLAQHYGEKPFHLPALLRFGTWIGGDRDGNPNVTCDVTRQTLTLLRRTALEKHLATCERIASMLSISEHYHAASRELHEALADARERWSPPEQVIEQLNPNEPYRHWLAVMAYRLRRSAEAQVDGPVPEAAYTDAGAFEADLALIERSLRAAGHELLADGELRDWQDRAAAFGLHMARLDVREDARRLQRVVAELGPHFGLPADFADHSEHDKQRLLGEPVNAARAHQFDPAAVSDDARETFELFVLLGQASATFGPRALGMLIASMTHQPSDVLTMLWLSAAASAWSGQPAPRLPIVPLFETIDDLEHAPDTLKALLACEPYAEHLRTTGGHQVCMIGYSDSTKDGGYLAANWHLYEAQRRLTQTAHAHGISVSFFHGRGGALGRGGGPAARGILSLPADSVQGHIRITEQGEVLADRYDNPHIAHRHLEQVTWATMLVSAAPPEAAPEAWTQMIDAAAKRARQAYRDLVDDPAFLDYFQHASPIEIIESLPIASRPSRRQAKRALEDLRAIPYTFAWTQNRHVLTAFYGLGAGLGEVADAEVDGWTHLQQMYREWPFFTAVIDNAELALAKCDEVIIDHYAELLDEAAGGDDGRRLGGLVRAEYRRTRDAVLRITGRSELLRDTPWLHRSVAVRNPYVDQLNFIQIELMRRLEAARDRDADEAALESLRSLLRMSVQGLAAGLRSTG
ncbi:MAG: phosphoenolpyruvate carboxylase [Phycisphaeraceae bacterium]